eukprot:IDg18092t1
MVSQSPTQWPACAQSEISEFVLVMRAAYVRAFQFNAFRGRCCKEDGRAFGFEETRVCTSRLAGHVNDTWVLISVCDSSRPMYCTQADH